MADIQFRCSACNRQLAIEKTFAGCKTRCPACGVEQMVPAPWKPPSSFSARLVEECAEPRAEIPTNIGRVIGGSDEFAYYDAFISYRHVEPDRTWAKWLHSQLETYRVPRKLAQQHKLSPRLKRVFRDEEELPASFDLNGEIEDALFNSRFLIVICSPRTPESAWVNAEVSRFRDFGRHNRILALLVDGEPGESFPQALREIRRTVDGSGLTREAIEEVEPLAADVRPTRKESRRQLKRMARLRILACILGVSFDDLRQREKERGKRGMTVWSVVTICLLLLLGGLAFRMLAERGRAQTEHGRAEEASSRAMRETEAARRSLYFTQIRQAEVEQQQGAQARVMEQMEACPEDLRGWEWHRLYNSSQPASQKPTVIKASVSPAGFSPDGTRIALKAEPQGSGLWDFRLGKLMVPMEGTLMTFSPDGKQLVANHNNSIQILNAQTGEKVMSLIDRKYVGAARFSPDGRQVVLALSETGNLKAFNPATGKELWTTALKTAEMTRHLFFSPDSRDIIAVSLKGKIAVFDAATGNLKSTMESGLKMLESAAVSPDGKLLVTVGLDHFDTNLSSSLVGKAQVWNIENWPWQLVRDLRPPGRDNLASAAFSPDGQVIAGGGMNAFTGRTNQTIHLWDALTGRKMGSIPTSEQITWLGFSPDGRRLVAESRGTSSIWAYGGGQVRDGILSGHTFSLSSVRFSHDSRRLISRSEIVHEGKLWDVGSQSLVRNFFWRSPQYSDGDDVRVAFNSDESRFVFIEEYIKKPKMLVVLCATTNGATLNELPAHESGVNFVAFSPDDKRIVTGGNDGTVWVRDPMTGQLLLTLKYDEERVANAAYSDDGTLIITTAWSRDGHSCKTRVWDAKSGLLLMTMSAGWSNGRTCVYQVWDQKNETPLRIPISLETNRAGSIVLTTNAIGQMDPWSTEDINLRNLGILRADDPPLPHEDPWSTEDINLRNLRILRADAPLLPQVERILQTTIPFRKSDLAEFDPTGHYDVRHSSILNDRDMVFRDLATRTAVFQIPMESRRTYAVSADGKQIAFPGLDNTIRLWNSANRSEVLTLRGHTDRVLSLAFSPDGRRIVSGSQDQTVRIWDVVSGSEAMTLRGHQGGVSAVAFSPNNRYIASGSEDKTVRIWDSGLGAAVLPPSPGPIVETAQGVADIAPPKHVQNEPSEPSWVKKITLSGLSGPADRRLALINGKALARGETASVNVAGKTHKLRCLEIRETSVLVEIEGLDKPRELSLTGAGR